MMAEKISALPEKGMGRLTKTTVDTSSLRRSGDSYCLKDGDKIVLHFKRTSLMGTLKDSQLT